MDEVTTELILSTLEHWIKTKTLVDTHTWTDAAQKLNILIGDEHDKLFNLQQQVALMKVSYISEGKSVAEAKSRVEAEDVYREMQRQKARISQIEEAIRIAKLQARLKDNEYRNQ